MNNKSSESRLPNMTVMMKNAMKSTQKKATVEIRVKVLKKTGMVQNMLKTSTETKDWQKSDKLYRGY